MNSSSETETAKQLCLKITENVRKKADHNKTEAMVFLVISLVATLTAPLFITLGSGLLFGKVVPASLSVIATFCTTWLQLRKPQQLWSLYRGAQRELEDEELKHRFCVSDYGTTSDRDKLLVERVARIALTLHERWAPLVPNPEGLRMPSAPAALPIRDGDR